MNSIRLSTRHKIAKNIVLSALFLATTQPANIQTVPAVHATWMNSDKECAFLHAAWGGKLGEVKKFVEKGGNINICSYRLEQVTALHLAANNDRRDVVKYILANGGDINAQSVLGDTPIHLAARKGHLDIVAQLLEHGASIDIQNVNHKTALQLAEEKGHTNIVHYITLAMGLNRVLTNLSGFGTFAAKYFEIKDQKEAQQNLTNIISIAAASGETLNLEFLEKLFVWMKAHKTLRLEHHKDEDALFDPKWFYLELATQAKKDLVDVWLKRCFEYLEADVWSAFNKAVNDFISTKKNILKNNQDNQDDLHAWDKICEEKNMLLQKKIALASLQKITQKNSEKPIEPAKKGFRDIYITLK